MKNYTRTDLACEKKREENKGEPEVTRNEMRGFLVTEMKYPETEENEDNAAASESGKADVADRFITIFCGRMWELDDSKIDDLVAVIADCLKSISGFAYPKDRNPSVLVVGLGNSMITADALGPATINGITVTRHLLEANKSLYDALKHYTVSAITPGVVGQTGIETVELIRGSSKNVRPDFVLVIDALAARSCERLATTVQLSNTGISPGSGIGNRRKAINMKSIGCPVISLGVPTVVDSSTLVWDALEKAGVKELSKENEEALSNGTSFFVTLKETDVIIREVSRILSKSIDLAFSR